MCLGLEFMEFLGLEFLEYLEFFVLKFCFSLELGDGVFGFGFF